MKTEQLHGLIKSAVVSEKTMTAAESNNQYTFNVDKRATKLHVKQAIQKLFGVNVLNVNILNRKGKVKRTRAILGKRGDTKKAIITLAPGESIEVIAAE